LAEAKCSSARQNLLGRGATQFEARATLSEHFFGNASAGMRLRGNETPNKFLTETLNHLRYTVAQKPPLYAVNRNQDRVSDNGDWQKLYYDAVVELDPIKLLQKIEAAQEAIGDRLRDGHAIDSNEQQLIEDARHNLYFLKKHPAA
jgi:hypothetical protein